MWSNLLQKIKKQKDKIGMNSLTLVVGALMALVAIGGLADLTILQTKFSALSMQSGYVARVVANQGGISTSQIDNFHGRYVTSQELYSNISSAMNHAGISNDEWKVKIGGVELTPATHINTRDYGETLPIRVEIDYSWALTGNFIPGNKTNKRSTETEVITTHRIRDDGFFE